MGKHDPKKKTFNYKSSGMVEDCEGVKGATADFVCFHCPLVASAEAKSLHQHAHTAGKCAQLKSRKEKTKWASCR